MISCYYLQMLYEMDFSGFKENIYIHTKTILSHHDWHTKRIFVYTGVPKLELLLLDLPLDCLY